MASTKLAFGIEPSNRAYRLRLSRYWGLAHALADYIRQFPAEQEIMLLDVGAGRGRSKMYLEHMNLPHQVRFHGVDIEARYMEQIYNRDEWHLTLGDVQQGLPFADATFDIVICEQVMEHLDHPEIAMREASRVLKPGGLFVAGVPIFFLGYPARRYLIPIIDKLTGFKRGHIQTFSSHSFVKQIEQAGPFKIEAARGFRIVSGGPLGFLEDYRWYWQLNNFLGRVLAPLTCEIQVIARKDNASQSVQTSAMRAA